jgi:hypothetical protein
LKELLAKGFLAPRTPNVFWVNSALFFKGDRVLFVKEYVRKRGAISVGADAAKHSELEANKQHQLSLS